MTTNEPRRFLLARPGHPPIYPMQGPAYKMTRAQSMEAVAYYRAVYGEQRVIVDAGEDWCPALYPGNGSTCELPHGHDGDHSYHENRRGIDIRWNAEQAQEVRP